MKKYTLFILLMFGVMRAMEFPNPSEMVDPSPSDLRTIEEGKIELRRYRDEQSQRQAAAFRARRRFGIEPTMAHDKEHALRFAKEGACCCLLGLCCFCLPFSPTAQQVWSAVHSVTGVELISIARETSFWCVLCGTCACSVSSLDCCRACLRKKGIRELE